MRPITLKMTAFGSYAKEAGIDFTKLVNGLYLITGDTGAGKTTIFDAVVFALFGEVSGSERKPLMMHSDLVDKSVPTVVELVFTQDGRRYTVTRKIQFTKKRATGVYDDPKILAELKGEEMAPVSGASEVTRRCEELLGLNADQFRKIVMLAQGEFREFLKAPSDKKNEILGKLFDSSRFVYLQKLLFGARKLLSDQRDTHSRALREALSRLQPADPTPETETAYLAQNPALLENLLALISEETDRYEAAREACETLRNALNELHRQYGEAEINNRSLEELEKARTREAELQKKQPEMSDLRKKVERAETALVRALPAIESEKRASRALKTAREFEQRCEASVRALESKREAAGAVCGGDAELQTLLQQTREQRIALEGQLALFDQLERAEQQLQKARENLSAQQLETERISTGLADLERRIAGLQAALEPLTEVDSRVLIAERAAQDAKTALDAWKGADGVEAGLSALQERNRLFDRQYAAYQQAERKAAEANDYAYVCYRRFVDGQAAVLAGELRDRLAGEGSALCPVCGTHLTPDALPRLAEPEGEPLTQQTVEEARKAAEALESQRRKLLEACHAEQSALEADQTALLQRAQAVRLDCDSWQQLCDRTWFKQAGDSLEAACRGKNSALLEALTAKERRDQLRGKLERAAASMENGRNLQKQTERKLSDAETSVGAAEAMVRTLQGQLTSGSREAAEQARRRLLQSENGLSETLRAHAEELQNTEKQLADACGRLKSAAEARIHGEEAFAEAKQSCASVLEETGFADVETVETVLRQCGDTPKRWIADHQGELSRFDLEWNAVENRIRTLEEQTRGRSVTDLPGLQARIKAADQDYREKTAEVGIIKARLYVNRGVLTTVEQEKQALADTDEAWTRLDEMGRCGIGVQSEGGKLSFDRYVMGAVFKEILEMANRRLAVISGGRYELIHRTTASRVNANAGLEIEVLDVTTGKQRSSASLSGGEAFYTSLALALGLSDVVQNHAGGKKLDALFIDEGFGTLDDDMLGKALEVLNQLTEGNRLVGIISHVDKLDASIPQKIVVTNNGSMGSSLKMTE